MAFVEKALSTGSLRKYQGSEQDVCVCVCVCVWVCVSSGKYSVVRLQYKRLFSVTSIGRDFPVVSIPLDIPFDEEDH